jgi:hypothetical protein
MDFVQTWKDLKGWNRKCRQRPVRSLIPSWIGKKDTIYTVDDASKCMVLNNFYLARAFGAAEHGLKERPECARLFESEAQTPQRIILPFFPSQRGSR